MYIAADTTPVDVDHTAHAGGPTMFTLDDFQNYKYFLCS